MVKRVTLSKKRPPINTILIRQAFKYLRKGSVLEAVGCLEQVSSGKRGPYVDYLLSVAYLKSDRLASASDIVRNALRHYPDYAPFKEILTYLALKSGSSKEQVIGPIIQYGQEYPESRKIRRMHKRLLKSKDFAKFQRKLTLEECITLQKPPAAVEATHFKRDRAAFNLRFRPSNAAIVALVLIVVAVAVTLSVVVKKSVFTQSSSSSEISTEHFRLDNHRYPLIDTEEGGSRFSYSNEKQLLEDYEKSRRYLKDGKNNEALVILNRIMLSNVNISVKDRVAFLKEFIRRMDEKQYQPLSADKLIGDSALYSGFYVVLTGKINNYKSSEGSTVFTLLINEKDNQFDAVAEVVSDTPLNSIENGSTVTVKGEFLKAAQNERIIVRADTVTAE
ncbi:MAG: hypothetical protein PF637_13100 [Spirochaetes bacterium]|nr:hypothetical protein [Spirochaetota bacterium]